MTKRISYLSKTYDDFKKEIRSYTKKYYPNILSDFSDASIGQWLVDINAGIADELSYHIDRSFQETQIDFAQERRSLLAIARTNSLKIPGKKTSLVEVEISCDVQADGNGPNKNYYPIVRAGTKAIGGGKVFELTEDVDFSSQFNKDGVPNRQIIPKRNSNGDISGYTIKKLEIMAGSETKFYSKEINDYDVRPFMEVILPETNVVSIESILFKEGTNFKYRPTTAEFMVNKERFKDSKFNKPTWRYFEVDNLVQDKLFLDELDEELDEKTNLPQSLIKEESFGKDGKDKFYVSNTKGHWKYITQKYVTEYTDKGYMKITFGAGSEYNYMDNLENEDNYTKEKVARIINNKMMGVLPNPGWTMFIMYRVGGGYSTNIARGVLNSFSFKDVEVNGADALTNSAVIKSLRITNTSPSVSGRDEPTNEEIRHMIKYNSQSQERCVTLQDYYDRIYKMPSKYGTPYRVGIIEKNNKIEINVLGVDANGNITGDVSNVMLNNIADYLSEYKMLGDYIIVKPGKLINLGVECDLLIDKVYEKKSIMREVINVIENFFSKNKRRMGENLYVSELIRNINNINGILNIIDLRVYNEVGGDYSSHRIRQQVITGKWENDGTWVPNSDDINRLEIDLDNSEGILYADTDSMYEIKIPNKDIKLKIKTN